MALKVYRECSEYVHGNVNATLNEQLDFNQEIFESWHEKAKTVQLVAMFSLCARYVAVANDPTRSTLEPVLIEYLGHIRSVRAILGATVEDQLG